MPQLSIPANTQRVPQHWQAHNVAHSLRQDLSAHFLSTGERPHNFLKEASTSLEEAEEESSAAAAAAAGAAGGAVDGHGHDDRFGGDPLFARFSQLKRELVEEWSGRQPYMAHRVDLRRTGQDLPRLLDHYEFDVIVVDPPWKEYQERDVRRKHGIIDENSENNEVWSLEDLKQLPLGALAAEPALMFLWCGTGQHLAEGAALLAHWGFKFVEDVCWIQTNKSHARGSQPLYRGASEGDDGSGGGGGGGGGDGSGGGERSILQRTHEHCLMGLRGESFIMRDRDMLAMGFEERMNQGMVQFVHPGAEIDVIVGEQPPMGRSVRASRIARSACT